MPREYSEIQQQAKKAAAAEDSRRRQMASRISDLENAIRAFRESDRGAEAQESLIATLGD